MPRLEGKILKSIQTSQILIAGNPHLVHQFLQIGVVFLIDKQTPIDQAAKMFQTGQAVLIERALQVVQGERSRTGRVFQIDKAGLIDREISIDQGGRIDKELLIDQGGRIGRVFQIDKVGRIGRVFQIDKSGHIDREISIGAVRN